MRIMRTPTTMTLTSEPATLAMTYMNAPMASASVVTVETTSPPATARVMARERHPSR